MTLVLFVILLAFFVVFPILGMAVWALISTIVVGLVIGALGRLVVPGSQPIGFLATFLAGLTGAILGGFLGNHVFGVNGFATTLLEIGVAAIVVAVITGPLVRRRYLSGRPR